MTIDNINLHSYPGSEKTYMHGEIWGGTITITFDGQTR